MKKVDTTLGLLRIPLDILAVMAALLLSFRLREASVDLIPNVQLLEPANSLPVFDYYIRTFIYPSTGLYVVLAAAMGLYSLKLQIGFLREMARVVLVAVLWIVSVMAWYFLVEKQLFYSRILLAHSMFFIATFSIAARIAVRLLQHALLRHGVGCIFVASIGSREIASAAKKLLTRDIRYTYLGHLQSLDQLIEIQKTCTPDLVVQTDPNPKSNDTISLIDHCRSSHIGYAFLPPVLADVPHQLHVERLGTMPLIRFQPTPLDGWGRVIKRLFDIVGSTILLLLLAPILLLTTVAVLLDGGLPILYISKRVGERGSALFPMFKFRSMVKNADSLKNTLLDKNERKDGPLFKMKEDPRITKLGKMLRRFDIDELPQLLNVLFGHMSLVGPRPHLPEEVKQYKQFQRRVFAVKPGITGMAQIAGRSDLTFDEEVRLDLQYIEEWSLARDIKILLQTVVVVLTKGG